jgi:hypothetical protein
MIPRTRPLDPRLFRILLPLLFLPLIVAVPRPASAQSASGLIQAMMERYEERMSGIENYTVTQDAMGFATTTYFERGEDGTFTMTSSAGSGGAQRMPAPGPEMLRRVADVSTLEGMEDVAGRTAHVILIEDIEALSESGSFGPAGTWEDATVRMWIDEERLIPLQMGWQGTMTVNGKSGPVSSTIVFEDYREEQGLLHPFTTRITTEGMAEIMDISEEQMEEMRQGMAQLQEQMESMPAAQRGMMERMMGGQLERMREMMSSGAMNVVVQVTEVRVNAGPPQG